MNLYNFGGFVLELPVVTVAEDLPASAAKPADEQFEPELLPTAKILVLDDARPLAEMLGEMLSLLGLNVTVCFAAVDALQSIDQQEFDLIFSDIRMPGIDGREFYQLATQKRPELARRIVFLTGDVVSDDTSAFLESVGNPHIAKPFHLSSIEEVLEKMLAVSAAA